MDKIWACMLIVGIGAGILSGNGMEISTAIVDSAGKALDYALGIAGVIAMWSGIMHMAEAEGLLEKLTKGMERILVFLFPSLPKGHLAGKYITLNMAANILGLGWAATPAGLLAMKSLNALEDERRKEGHPYALPKGVASREMCTFLVLNVSSLQLIPMTIIAYRHQFGSEAPTSIIGPAIITTFISTMAGIGVIKIMGRRP